MYCNVCTFFLSGLQKCQSPFIREIPQSRSFCFYLSFSSLSPEGWAKIEFPFNSCFSICSRHSLLHIEHSFPRSRTCMIQISTLNHMIVTAMTRLALWTWDWNKWGGEKGAVQYRVLYKLCIREQLKVRAFTLLENAEPGTLSRRYVFTNPTYEI